MPKKLFILNDPPYGTERSYNALRLAADDELTDTTHRSSLEELTNWVQWADRTLVF
jgi:sulfur relay (sulfurtransferase) complex TusBCD TusD component (DsrE family)